jgi:hypothetical protein
MPLINRVIRMNLLIREIGFWEIFARKIIQDKFLNEAMREEVKVK